MKRIALVGIILLACMPATLQAQHHLGPTAEGSVIPSPTDECTGGVLAVHHDGSFEYGLSWEHEGVMPEYCGAFAEAYALGPGTIVCAALWLTTIPNVPSWIPSNIYVWEGGVSGEPGAVLYVVQGVQFTNLPIWPAVGENDVPISLSVTGDFSIGYWPNFQDEIAGYFVGLDVNGPGGFPWTYVAPGLGLPSGWQSPEILWPYGCRSLGLGAYFDNSPTPVEAPTWGAVKNLFNESRRPSR